MSRLSNIRVWTALVTPFTPSGELDFEAITSLLRRQESAGNGVVLLGSTGEGLALPLAEKKALVRHATSLRLRVPLMAGVGGAQLEECRSWIRFCEEAGVEGFLLVTPIYAKPGAQGQTEWFRVLLETTALPCMLYNVPGRSAVKLHPQALRALAGHPRLWAVKESSGSTSEFLSYRACAPELRFYCGDDALMPYFASAGAVGLVSVASNAWPDAVALYTRLSLAGKHETLLPLWHNASEALFTASNPVPIKALLAAKGWIASPKLLPPLNADDLPSVQPLLEADHQVGEWFRQQEER